MGNGKIRDRWRKVPVDPKNNWNYQKSNLKRYELKHIFWQEFLESKLNCSYEEGDCQAFPKDLWSNFEAHLTNMIKVFDDEYETKYLWKQMSAGRRVDWRDCVIYTLSINEIFDLRTLLVTKFLTPEQKDAEKQARKKRINSKIDWD